MPHHIEFTNRQSLLVLDEPRLLQVLTSVLDQEGITTSELSVAVVDNAEIHAINRQFLAHDCPTDVISFSWNDPPVTRPGQTDDISGELVVSAETAIEQASQVGWSPSDELLLYLVHGLLHLCGYDDLTDEARPIMRRRERDALAPWGLVPQHLQH